jgi:hypothetical protein
MVLRDSAFDGLKKPFFPGTEWQRLLSVDRCALF